jgi:hypothetical protein
VIADTHAEQFKVAAEDSACSHIVYAACHDTAYLSQLVPLSGVREKVTLVQGASWNPEFHQFNLNVTHFPTVFRWSDVPTAPPSIKSTYANGPVPLNLKGMQKKSSPVVPLGPRQSDAWAKRSLSPRGSITESDRASTTNGIGNGSGISLGNKATSSHKSSQQPCKYFQKVRFHESTPHHSHVLTQPGLLSFRHQMYLPAWSFCPQRHSPAIIK